MMFSLSVFGHYFYRLTVSGLLHPLLSKAIGVGLHVTYAPHLMQYLSGVGISYEPAAGPFYLSLARAGNLRNSRRA
jgi:hypothetical protein